MTLVYGIESSCDDTGLALVRVGTDLSATVVAEVISSQTEIHKLYGGIVPELASRAHLDNLPVLHDQLFEMANSGIEEVDCIAVTSGPGLKGCLLMGVSFASGLATVHNKPVYGINHIEGHLLSPMMDNPSLRFPYLCLVVSGGHTEMHVVQGVGKYELLGRTIDDAAGEAFDKSAHLLGFDYPGGPELARLADSCPSSNFDLPIAMRGKRGFSFSGLKTAISLLVQREQERENPIPPGVRASLSFAIQEAVIESLMIKVRAAIRQTGLTSVAIAGGVSANKRLRGAIESLKGCKSYFAKMQHCVDNGAMIAYVAGQRVARGEEGWEHPYVLSRWPVESLNAP